MTSKKQIENAVIQAMTQMIEKKTRAPFSFALVPSKRLADGGLGATWPAWHALLVDLAKDFLPSSRPYSGLKVDVMLVDTTYNKDLRSLRYWLVERLLLIEKHGV